jgi:23S rRNA (adenine2503-C2)-methyltransferase
MTPLPLVFQAPKTGVLPTHFADLDLTQRRVKMGELGIAGFRADQIARHYYTRFENDPITMTDLPPAMREQLATTLLRPLLTPVRTLEADSGTTRKTLWRLHDGALVESVVMRYPARFSNGVQVRADRITVCVSSQAGCGMACPFCATGQGGLTRNLSTAEIVEQVVAAARSAAKGELSGGPGRLSNVVFMGMGEPLANYSRLVAALHRLIDPAPAGLGLSRRSITVSSVGLVPAITKLADEDLAVTLAVSLHAPDDGLRDTLVPVNTRWKVCRAQRAPLLRGVRDDPRRQRSAVACRATGRPARASIGPRELDSAQPDAGIAVGCLAQAGGGGVRAPARGSGRLGDGP